MTTGILAALTAGALVVTAAAPPTAVRYAPGDSRPHPVAAGGSLPAYSLTLIEFRR
jgi:hypothetical protein